VDRLAAAAFGRNWPVILHPDAVHDASLWLKLGHSPCIENMDKRQAIGRTAEELARVFNQFPEASLCFDIGHARQIDATMTEAYLILTTYRDRLQQVHMGEVNTRSKHDPLSIASNLAFQDVADLIPQEIPVIPETTVPEEHLMEEIAKAVVALPFKELAKTRRRDLVGFSTTGCTKVSRSVADTLESRMACEVPPYAVPFPLNTALLITVIAVFEMPLCVASTACHGWYRQHTPTLTLFEIPLQAKQRDWSFLLL
jgi:hypothetical protein